MADDSITGKIGDAIKGALADATGKQQTGFEPTVCHGCPHQGDDALRRCGLCGCPTIRNGGLDQAGMTPNGCPRAESHRQQSGGD